MAESFMTKRGYSIAPVLLLDPRQFLHLRLQRLDPRCTTPRPWLRSTSWVLVKLYPWTSLFWLIGVTQ